MATVQSVKAKLQGLIDKSNATTGKNDADLTTAVNTLVEGYGKGGSGEDLAGVLDEQSQLIAELKEKLANGGGSQECDCIIDVTELPAEYKDVNVYVRFDESTYMTFLQILQSEGLNADITYYVVDELPTEGKVSDFNSLTPIHCYIANNIPYMYGDLGGGNTWVTLSSMMAGFDIPMLDKGFTSDITAETEAGIYVTYKEGEKPVEGAVYRKSFDECEVWLVADGETQTYSDFWAKFGATVQAKYYLVDTLPDIMEKFKTIISDTHVICNFYILKDTGVAYYSEDGTKENAVTLTTGMTITDKGWVDDIDSIDNTDSAQAGAYTTRSQYIAFYTYTDGKWDEYQGDVKTAEEIKNKVRKTVEAFDEFFNYSSDVIQPIVIPEGVNDIGHTIIYGDNVWGIKKITFPKSLMRLYKGAVRACPDLETVIFKGKPLNVNYQAFMECNYIKNIYVPWAEGEVERAPWGAPSTATIHYNTDTSSM